MSVLVEMVKFYPLFCLIHLYVFRCNFNTQYGGCKLHCLKPKSCAICNVLKRENTMFFCPCLTDLRVNVMRIFVTIWTLNPCKGRGIKTFRKKALFWIVPEGIPPTRRADFSIIKSPFMQKLLRILYTIL